MGNDMSFLRILNNMEKVIILLPFFCFKHGKKTWSFIWEMICRFFEFRTTSKDKTKNSVFVGCRVTGSDATAEYHWLLKPWLWTKALMELLSTRSGMRTTPLLHYSSIVHHLTITDDVLAFFLSLYQTSSNETSSFPFVAHSTYPEPSRQDQKERLVIGAPKFEVKNLNDREGLNLLFIRPHRLKRLSVTLLSFSILHVKGSPM